MIKICMIGTGYVGLVTGACLADFGNRVVCVDINEDRINQLHDGIMPIYEPGLKELVKRNVDGERLDFTTDLASAVAESDVVFIAVGTPSADDGSTDLSYVFKAAEDVAQNLQGYTVVVQKSTAPVGTARRIGEHLAKHVKSGTEFDMVSNPEFLREGSAIEDFLRPNRVVIGAETDRAEEMMAGVYRPLYLLETPIVRTNLETAELIKYASNAFLATKISFINEIARICELTGADVDGVAKGMGLDGRIGPKFLHAGIGYGGSCLPKDVSSLIHVAGERGYDAPMLRAAHTINFALVDAAIDKLTSLAGDVKGKTVGLLGVSFKPNTDDLRDGPALRLTEKLLAAGAKLKVFDPIAMDNFRTQTKFDVEYCKNAYDCAEDCDALMLVTEWNEFRELDFDRLKRLMKAPKFIDCRNVYRTERVTGFGFEYDSFGRGRVES